MILIITDDQDYEHFGFQGKTVAHTPTIDRLAESGTVFTCAHAPVSRCRPSLASLLSGRWPHQHGIFFNEGETELDESNALPALFRDAGYATFLIGKFWEGDPERFGFEDSFPNKNFCRTGQEPLFRFLDAHAKGERPMFIWWSPLLPHLPHDAPQEYVDAIDADGIPDAPWAEGEQSKYREREHRALANVAWLDDCLRLFFEKLRALDLEKDTLFVLFSDNGFSVGLVSKGSPFEKGLRTPLIFSWEGQIPRGARREALASIVDVYPTVLDYAGIAIPEGTAGQSLRLAVDNPEEAHRTTLFGALYPRKMLKEDPRPARNVYAFYARSDEWKYVLYLRNLPRTNHTQEYFTITSELAPFLERRRGDEDLYNLRDDPYELRNLSAEPSAAAMISDFRAGILDWWTRTGGGPIKLPD